MVELFYLKLYNQRMKILLSFLILFLVFAPFLTFAQTEVVYPSFPGVVAPQDIVREAQTEKEILPLFIDYIFRLILVISLIAVIGVILYAGTLYLLSTGNPIKTKIAREWILSAIQGTLVIFSSYALLYALDSQLVLFGLRNLEKGDRVERVDLNWEIRNSYFQIPFGLLIEDAILNENAKNKLYDVLDATNEAEAVAEAIYQGSKQLLAIIESCPVGMLCGGGGPANNPGNIPYSPPPSSQRLTNASIPPTSPQAQIFATNNQSPTTINPSSTTGPPSPSSNENSSFGEDETGGIGDPSVVFPDKEIRRGDNYSITASDAFIVSNEKNRMPPDYLLDLFAFPDYEERQAELDEIEETIETLRQDSWMRGLLEEQKDLFAEKTELFREDRINHILDVKDVIQEPKPGNIPFGSKVQEKLNAADYLLLQEGYFADLYNNPDLTFSEKNNIAKDILNVVDRIGLGSKNPTNYGFEGPVTVYDIKEVERWWYPALTDAAGNIVKDENGYTVYSEELSYALISDVPIARGVWGTPENLTDDNGRAIQLIFEILGFVSLPILDKTSVNSNQGWRKYTDSTHDGTDFSVDDYITEIIAVSDQYVAETQVGGGGGVTLVSHIPLNKNTYIKTISSHLSGTEVTPGMTVSAGTIIGTGGNTGHSTGPHLHWEAHLVVTDDDGNIISDKVIRNDALFSPESIKSVGGSVTNEKTPFMERVEFESFLFSPPLHQLFPPLDTQNKNDYFLNYYNSIMSPFSSLFGIQLVFASDRGETRVRRFLSADGGGKSSPGTKSLADLNEEGLTAFHGGGDHWMRGVYPSFGEPKKQEHSEEEGDSTEAFSLGEEGGGGGGGGGYPMIPLNLRSHRNRGPPPAHGPLHSASASTGASSSSILPRLLPPTTSTFW